MDWLLPIKQIFEFFLPLLNELAILRALLGFILVFFLPGFAWTFVFFKQLEIVERIALSFGLSIALVPLSITALNVLFKMRISGFNSLLVIGVLTILPVAIYYLRKLLSEEGEKR